MVELRRPSPGGSTSSSDSTGAIFELEGLSVHYGSNLAVSDVTMNVDTNSITAIIGPSGCGKSTLLRSLNRMNDLIPNAEVSGSVRYQGIELYAPTVDPVKVRRSVGMVFQRPNPFPKSIYDNVAFGLRVAGISDALDDRVKQALQSAALWDEVKSNLKRNAFELSGGQQQRLCIARAIANQPDAILMDEPASALDPVSTARIEDLMQQLKENYSIVIVTHNMQQAARVSDRTAFMTTVVDEASDARTGMLVEYDRTDTIFTHPADERTEAYITGRFG